jgi:hypothetical protein
MHGTEQNHPLLLANAQVFAAMGIYYVERMEQCVVINAPSWFELPWWGPGNQRFLTSCLFPGPSAARTGRRRAAGSRRRAGDRVRQAANGRETGPPLRPRPLETKPGQADRLRHPGREHALKSVPPALLNGKQRCLALRLSVLVRLIAARAPTRHPSKHRSPRKLSATKTKPPPRWFWSLTSGAWPRRWRRRWAPKTWVEGVSPGFLGDGERFLGG